MKLLSKVGIILLLSLLLWIPLALVGGLAGERESYKYDVTEEIGQSYGSAQSVAMPYLIVFLNEYWESVDEDGKKYLSSDDRTLLVPPVQASLEGDVQVEPKNRGIYTLNVFSSELEMRGSFQADAIYKELQNRRVNIKKIEFAFVITDPKGLKYIPEATVGGQPVSFDRERDGGNIILFGELDPELILNLYAQEIGNEPEKEIDFALSLALSGSSSISFIPTGMQSDISLSSNWSHPSFTGDMLPDSREISDSGFTANWQSTGLSGQYFSGAINVTSGGYMYDLMDFKASTSFVDVIDVYSLVDRSVKYGILIIFLTFLVLFVVEILTNVRIHVLQYVMTGSALVVFFLLLLALSEHIAFGISYMVGAAACVALITFYLFYTLKSIKSTAIFSLFLAALYLVLYMLLNMGDYALLIGSLLIFAILATVMVVTRKLNWYEVKG